MGFVRCGALCCDARDFWRLGSLTFKLIHQAKSKTAIGHQSRNEVNGVIKGGLILLM
jgi:hypothetical protein